MSDSLHAEDVVDAAGFAAFPLVGALLLVRGVAPRVGWLYAAVGVLVGAGFLAGGVADQEFGGAPVASLLADVAFVSLVSLLLTFIPLFLPDGRLPSRRWRPVASASVVVLAVTSVTTLLMPGPVDEDSATSPDNPLGVPGAQDTLEVAQLVALAGFAVLALVCLASLLLRLRHATGETRRQVRTLGIGVAVLTGLFLLDGTLQGMFGDVYGIVAAVVATTAVPVATALALLGGVDRPTRAVTDQPE